MHPLSGPGVPAIKVRRRLRASSGADYPTSGIRETYKQMDERRRYSIFEQNSLAYPADIVYNDFNCANMGYISSAVSCTECQIFRASGRTFQEGHNSKQRGRK
jgi:hypothetical protein